jgi:hypothetical protein
MIVMPEGASSYLRPAMTSTHMGLDSFFYCAPI